MSGNESPCEPGTSAADCASTPDPVPFRLFLAAVSLLALVSLGLRLGLCGHLITWDEAMQLCTIRSFVAGWHDSFALWFWRHPPLYSCLMFMLRPFHPGFAERSVMLSAFLAALNLLLLARVLSRTHGRGCALAACAALALMPGACFFDVWIKTDHTVTTFGLLALLAAFSGRTVPCGVLTGLALLSKETAVFYLLPVAALLWDGRPPRDAWRRLAAWLAITLATSLWWYLWIAPWGSGGGLARIKDHVYFAGTGGAGWAAPWSYYLALLPRLLGISGLVLAATGTALLLLPGCRQPARRGRLTRFWPVLLVVPSMAGLSVLPGKVPWILITVLPGLAALQGAALAPLLDRAGARGPLAGALGVAGLLALATIPGPVFRADAYERMLKDVSPDQWRGSTASRQIAQKLNELAGPKDRVLLTSFHYWNGIEPGRPCPVFTCYFTGGSEFVLRPHDISLSRLEADIRQYGIRWAVLSPESGGPARALAGGLAQKYGLQPFAVLERALIYDVTPVPPTGLRGAK